MLAPERSPCPPPPILSEFDRSVIVFAERRSAASLAQLREMNARYGEGGHEKASVVLVVAGAHQRDVEAMKNELGIDFPAIADASGAIGQRFGIRVWPTTIVVEQGGTVTDVQVGHRIHSREIV